MPNATEMHNHLQLPGKLVTVKGTVQGVGFRPTVWRLAQQLGLVGRVWNEGDTVIIAIWGTDTALSEFIEQLPNQKPPLAHIQAIDIQTLSQPVDTTTFTIVTSQTGQDYTHITADAATCTACLADIFTPHNRRYRYAFTNCTNCGPRLSIINQIPYDRDNTTMAAFTQCAACLSEYQNPTDRRYHAQPNACPTCGPQLWLVDRQQTRYQHDSTQVITRTAELIKAGYIVVIKGLGSFHLACDATNQTAVQQLRERKHRYDKPFAIMVRDLTMLQHWAVYTPQEQQLISQPSAPIVLLRKTAKQLAAAVAPAQITLGCMLPYTPLHHLLLQELTTPIVLTSANVYDEPPCIDNTEACQRLAGIADYWLLHDRAISNRLDDSVVMVADQVPRIVRRARGYAPESYPLPAGFEHHPAVLAMGGELKNTFCLLNYQQAILSPHIGDLANATVQSDYRRLLALYQQLFQFKPEVLAVDLHPGYLSTQLGKTWAAQQDIPIVEIQHHHAHIAACMLEHQLPADTAPVLGVTLDGLGMGADGQLWGGEFIKADYRDYQRLASFQPIPLLGGEQASRQPWRNCYAQLSRYFDWASLSLEYAGLEIIEFLNQQPLAVLEQMRIKQLNSPLSSSCGRWFDAFAAALGICHASCSYEGQAAIGLEALATPVFASQRAFAYPYTELEADELSLLSWQPCWLAVLDDLKAGVAKAHIAARIHHGLAQAIANTALKLATQIDSEIIVLSGGVFQNRLLLTEVSRLIRLGNKKPLSPSQFPCNDGGLALGQAIIAAGKMA